MTHTLDISNLHLQYGFKRVQWNVGLHCETGKVTGILGRNGSGKSCLMKAVYGELPLKDQYVAIDGKVTQARERKPKDMRYLPQHNFVPGRFTIREVFSDFQVDINRFMAEFPEFSGKSRKRLDTFSTGERRIVEIFAILVSDSGFCLLDEPFSYLMPLHIEKLKEIIRREKETKGILITDHYFQDVVDLSDELFVLRGGQLWKVNDRTDLELLEYIKDVHEVHIRQSDSE